MKIGKLVLVMIFVFISVSSLGCSSETKVPDENVTAPVSENEKVVMPQEQPSLTGKVKDIVGNEVTVFKVQLNAGGERPAPEGQEPATGEANQDSRDPGQNRPTGFTVTEETETFIIPVGTPIVTMQRGTGETNTVQLTEIKKDQMLRVWMKDNIVQFVQIMGGIGDGTGTREGMGGNGERNGNEGGMGPVDGMGGMGGNRQP